MPRRASRHVNQTMCKQDETTTELTVVKEEADFLESFLARAAAVRGVVTQVCTVQRS